ncbi:MAG: hypothetical protein M0036_20820 [Desulfobacteraceae bacterium]|nr:hypothetical protein [Desulfobacteraceae bacterium]
MTTIQPHGENLRKAVQYISTERRDNPKVRLHKLIEQACLVFNLNPAEANYLERFTKEQDLEEAR